MTNTGVKYDAAANYQRMAETIRRQRALLERLEWAGTVVFDEWYDKGRCCPCCRAEQGDPHVDCELAEELGRA